MRVLMNYIAPFCMYKKATKPNPKKRAAMMIPVVIDF
jgi:hypothetical protein